MRVRNPLILVFAVAGSLSGCGKGIGGGPQITLNPVSSNSSGTALSSLKLGNALQGFLPQSIGMVSPFFASGAGDSGVGGLETLAYAVQKIRICDTITTTGTGYDTSGSSCITLYESGSGAYLDMTQMASVRAVINQGASGAAGTYNFGLVDWDYEIKVKGSVPLQGSGTLRTRNTGSTLVDVTNNGYTTTKRVSPELDTASTNEETTVRLNNGGSWIRFQDPFVYDGEQPITIDLVFNPDHLLKGSSACSNCDIVKDTSNSSAGIFVPMIKLTPVPRLASQTTKKEVYYLTYAGWDARIRMELYYIGEDASKTIKGVDLRTEHLAGASSMYLDPPGVFSLSQTGSTVSLKDWSGATLISFDRLSATGMSNTATLNCAATAGGGGWCPGSTSVNATLTLSNVVTVQ